MSLSRLLRPWHQTWSTGCERLSRCHHSTDHLHEKQHIRAPIQAHLCWRLQEAQKFARHAKRSAVTTEDVNNVLRLKNVMVRGHIACSCTMASSLCRGRTLH